jgi:cytochrome c-type biogenesis protein CcmH
MSARDWNRRLKRWPGWLLLVFAAVALLAVGAAGDRGERTPQDRVDAIAKRLACQTCDGQSVYESRVPSAINMRNEIARRVEEATLSDDEIIARLNETYGDDLLLLPTAEGINVLVWALPVAAAVTGVCGFVLVFRGWRREAADAGVPSDADRELVAAALQDEV